MMSVSVADEPCVQNNVHLSLGEQNLSAAARCAAEEVAVARTFLADQTDVRCVGEAEGADEPLQSARIQHLREPHHLSAADPVLVDPYGFLSRAGAAGRGRALDVQIQRAV